jgi:diacylglycerol kinase (ATP)
MTAKVILNPYAGRWKALKHRSELINALNAAGIDFDLVSTSAPGHGTELAAQAVKDGYTPIIAAGGDGSISEVINGLVQAVGDGPLPLFGVIPFGSANDLVDNLCLPKELSAAIDIIKTGNFRMMDLCQISWSENNQKLTRYFDNNAAVGLEPYITLIQQRIQWLHGPLRYLAATLRGVLDNPQWRVNMEWDNGRYDGPLSLVTVGNNPRTGGLFYVTPHADPFDGLLTFVFGYIPSRMQILRILPSIMKNGPGNYIEHPLIHEVNSHWLKITMENPTPMHADGEIQSTNLFQLEFCVLPARLPVLVG